jgi:hypothetical protein
MSVIIQDYKWVMTTVIALFGIIAIHRLTEKRSKAVEFRAAAKDFRNTVLNELKDIYPTTINWPGYPPSLLSAKFAALQVAVAEFEAFMPWYRRFMFKRAWRIYCVGDNPTSKKATQEYHQYMGFTINDHYIDPQKQLKQNIDRLLKYSKT